MEQHFERLQELIKDDDKIVTIASFASEAHIPIAESKKIFEKYVEINVGSKELTITYILNGKKKGEHHLSVSLVKNGNLEEEKGLYDQAIDPVIFSLQKAKNIDFNIIALVDSEGSGVEKGPILGAIIGKNCVKRVLRKKVLPILPPTTVRGKSTIFTKQNIAVKSESPKVEKEDVNSTQKKHEGNIANLFSKAAQNKKTDHKEVKQLEKKQKTNGGLSNFFTKQTSKEMQNNKSKKDAEIKSGSKAVEPNGLENKKSNSLNVEKGDEGIFNDDEILKDLEIQEETPSEKTTDEKKVKKSDLYDSDTDDEILKDLEIKKENVSEKKRENKKANKNKNKSKSNQKKKRGVKDVGNDKAVKKRKRIIVENESDSDDIFGSEKSDNDDIVENSEEEPETVKVEKKPLAPKNKRRKAVEKIYEDDDGYVVTKTEYVYETPSEDENEPEPKIPKVEEKPKPKIEKKGSSNSENDISPNKGTKSKKGANKKAPSGNQPTLMNFFKKK